MLERFRNEAVGPDYDKLMAALCEDMVAYGATDPEYATLMTYMERLDKLNTPKRWWQRVSPDTMAIVLGNVGVVALIIMYEQKHIMSKQGLGMLLKPKAQPNF